MERNRTRSDLEGYYTVKAFKYHHLVSWRVKDAVPGSQRREGRLGVLFCRKCSRGKGYRQGYRMSENRSLQRHLLNDHGIEVNRICHSGGAPGRLKEDLYMSIPQEDFVKGGGIDMYQDEMLWRWVDHAYELHKVRRCNPEEKSPGLREWNEEFWLQLIHTVKEVDAASSTKVGQKWNLVRKTLPPDLVAKFSSDEVESNVLRFRYSGLRWEIKRQRKPSRYTRGVTEPVIRAMKDDLKNRRGSADCKTTMKGNFSKRRPTEIKMDVSGHSNESVRSIRFSEQLEEEVNSLVKFLDEQLVPTAKNRLESCLDKTKQILGDTDTTPAVLKSANIEVMFLQTRREIISKLKQATCSLTQEIENLIEG